MVKEFIDLNDLKLECKRLSIDSIRIYRGRYKQIEGAPWSPKNIYKDDWISHDEFFGRAPKTFIGLNKLK